MGGGLPRKERKLRFRGVEESREKEGARRRRWCLCCHAEDTLRVPRYDLFSVDWFGHQRLLICFAKAVCVYVCSV